MSSACGAFVRLELPVAVGMAFRPISGTGRTRRVSMRILYAEQPSRVIIGKDFRISSPADDGAECVLGVVGTKMVFQFRKKAAPRRCVGRSLIEHPTDMRRKRHGAQKVVREQTLTTLHVRHGKRLARRRKLYVAFSQFGKAHHLGHLRQTKQIIDAEIQTRGKHGQVRPPAERRP